MSGASCGAGGWSGKPRPDDPRLGACTDFTTEKPPDLWPGRPVLVGFPVDEGVRRNGGRPGAAGAPAEIRHWLYRLTPIDLANGLDLAALRLLDLGDVAVEGGLEAAQDALGVVMADLLRAEAIPIVLGGGHETAWGHFLGHVGACRAVAVVNLDAHLDVRPLLEGQGHSGSPFRQALEHPAGLLRGYACLGAQPFAVSADHWRYLSGRGGTVCWAGEVRGRLVEAFRKESERLGGAGCPVWVSLDADVVTAADAPGVSAPGPLGLSGVEVAECLRAAGATARVCGLDVVEVNPMLDPDGRTARWAAQVVWHFLAGLASRPRG